MDDILIAAPTSLLLEEAYVQIVKDLENKGLVIAPEKVQRDKVGKFLGALLSSTQIRPQKIQLRTGQLETLNDFQKLLGDINWLRPYLPITTAELKPLFAILEGDPRVTSPRILTPESREVINKVEKAIEMAHLTRIVPTEPLYLCVLPTILQPTAVLWQKGPLLWIHEHASPQKTVEHYPTAVANLALQGLKSAVLHFGIFPHVLLVPYTPSQIQALGATVDDWAVLLCSFSGKTDNHYPKSPLLQFVTHHSVIFPKITSTKPLAGVKDIYTDGSKSDQGAYVVLGENPVIVQFEPEAPQIVECHIVCHIFKTFSEPFNLISDSHYVVNVVRHLEIAADISPKSPVASVLIELCSLIRQ